MEQKLAGQSSGISKMDAAADAVNRTIQAIAMRCSQGEEVRDYFHIAVIGYKTDSLGNPISQLTTIGDKPNRKLSTITSNYTIPISPFSHQT